MKILLATAELGYRGTPRVVAEYARMLSARHTVAVWGWRDAGGETVDVLRREGFLVFDGRMDSERAYAFQPDVLNIHRPGLPNEDESLIIKRFKAQGVKCIETNVFGRVDRSTSGMIDFSIQISLWDLYQWTHWKGALPIPGAYCPNPVDVDRFYRATSAEIIGERVRFGILQSEATNAFVLGRIGNTNWRRLAGPVRKLLKRYRRFHVVHVHDHSQSVPEDLRGHPRVHCIDRLVGYDQLSRFYSACSVCISMSPIGESFGLVNAEAMACGTPVLALSTPFHCNAQVEVVGLGGGTVISSVRDVEAVLSNMLETGEETSTVLHGKLRQSIVERYGIQKVRETLMAIFESVAAGRALPEGFVTNVSNRQIGELLGLVKGRKKFLESLGTKLYYTPIAYRLVQLAKGLLRK